MDTDTLLQLSITFAAITFGFYHLTEIYINWEAISQCKDAGDIAFCHKAYGR